MEQKMKLSQSLTAENSEKIIIAVNVVSFLPHMPSLFSTSLSEVLLYLNGNISLGGRIHSCD